MKYLLLTFLMLFTNLYSFSLKTINIYPNSIKQNSGLYVKKGEILEISVNGKWSLHEKYNQVTGEGHSVFKVNEYGNWGSLLGKIGNTDIFIVGNGTQIVSKGEGVLYLFPNKDNYKIFNPSGFLAVSVNGGMDLALFKSELEKISSKFIYDTKEDYLTTDLFVNKGDELKIYAFEYWTMWNNFYPEVTAEGHSYMINSVNFGKLFAGIGSSFADFLEVHS
ncbi:MAG: hypothetical protein JXB50_06405, partial [Spirochaetes bacterium]|nr:hypothetical protein [Spirochaetota bacterium]